MTKTLPVLNVEQLMLQKSMHRANKPDMFTPWRSHQLLGKMPTADNPLIVSVSELLSFLRCRVQHHWRHTCKLEPNQRPERLEMGTVGHKVQEVYYTKARLDRTRKWMKKVVRDVVRGNTTLTVESRELLEAMLIGYHAWVRNKHNDDSDRRIGLETGNTEQNFVFALNPQRTVLIRGKIDVTFVSAVKRKTACALESKFQKDLRMDESDNKQQVIVYCRALRELYPNMKEYNVWYNVLRKQKPGPRVTAPLFRRDELTRTTDEIRQWEIDTTIVAEELIDGAIYAAPADDCNWKCDFKGACDARGTDSMTDILQNEFRVKEDYAPMKKPRKKSA